MCWIHTWALALFVTVGTSAVGIPAQATPLRDDQNKGVISWPKDTTITVYIPADPDGLGRDKDLADGIKSWGDQAALKDKGIKIEVKTGTPPAGATNAVGVSWVDGQINGRYGEGGPAYSSNGVNAADGGSIKISRDTDQVTNGMARNLGVHEMGHVLGLDDTTKAGAAMNPAFTKNDTVAIGADDQGELKAVYSANAADTRTHIETVVSEHDGLFDYSYRLSWLGGGHLGLFQIDARLDDIESWIAPTGWELDLAGVGDDVTLDGQHLGAPERFISFVVRDEQSYLGQQFPQLVFQITAHTPPAVGEVFLSGRTGALVPMSEPTGLALSLAALIALAVGRARRPRAFGGASAA